MPRASHTRLQATGPQRRPQRNLRRSSRRSGTDGPAARPQTRGRYRAGCVRPSGRRTSRSARQQRPDAHAPLVHTAAAVLTQRLRVPGNDAPRATDRRGGHDLHRPGPGLRGTAETAQPAMRICRPGRFPDIRSAQNWHVRSLLQRRRCRFPVVAQTSAPQIPWPAAPAPAGPCRPFRARRTPGEAAAAQCAMCRRPAPPDRTRERPPHRARTAAWPSLPHQATFAVRPAPRPRDRDPDLPGSHLRPVHC